MQVVGFYCYLGGFQLYVFDYFGWCCVDFGDEGVGEVLWVYCGVFGQLFYCYWFGQVCMYLVDQFIKMFGVIVLFYQC